MPLVDIWLKPGYCIKVAGSDMPHSAKATGVIVKGQFAHSLPDLFVQNAEALRLESGTEPEGVQVMPHDYPEGTVNAANIWVKVQFSEECPSELEWQHVRDRLYELIWGWFSQQRFLPENLMLDIFWGPSHGIGTVDGVDIDW